MSQNWVQVIDEGRTEIPHGTLTAIAHTPYDKEQMNKDYPILSKLSML
jgi:peptidyl-tRNA hydrolase